MIRETEFWRENVWGQNIKKRTHFQEQEAPRTLLWRQAEVGVLSYSGALSGVDEGDHGQNLVFLRGRFKCPVFVGTLDRLDFAQN